VQELQRTVQVDTIVGICLKGLGKDGVKFLHNIHDTVYSS